MATLFALPFVRESTLSRVTPLYFCVLAALSAHALAGSATPAGSAPENGEVASPRGVDGTAAKRKPVSQQSATVASGHRVTLSAIEVRGTQLDDIRNAQAQVPGGVYVTSGEAFYQRPVNSMADALQYMPGVMAVSNAGGDDMVLSIRGSNLDSINYDNGGVALFQDGLPVTTADGANHNRMLDPLTASDVVVANGINALTYGASDLGGAIDFISRTARNSDPNQIYLQGGSYGLGEAQVSTGGVSGQFDGMMTLDDKHWGGYLQHSREDRNGFDANAGWQVSGQFHLRAYATYINDRQQLAGSLTRAEFDANPRQADPAYAMGNHQLNVKTGRFAVKGTWDINPDSRLEFGVSYELQRLWHPIVDVFVPLGPGPNPPLADVFSLLVNTDQRTAGGMVRYHLKMGNHDLLAGINLADTTDKGGNYANLSGRRGQQQDLVNTRGHSATLFLVDRWTFAPDWTLVYGAQGVATDLDDLTIDGVDQGNQAPRNQKNRFSSFNPRIGLIRSLAPNSEAFASVGRIYQSPNFFDLDNARMELGPHANLDAMHGTAYEFGLRGNRAASPAAPGWHWSLAAYYERIHDEILSVDDPNAPGISLTSNIPQTIHAGIEALVGASFPLADGAGRIEPMVSATFNDFVFDNDPDYGNHHLPSAPRYAVHGEVMYRRGNGFFAGPTFDAVGWRYADFANIYRVGGYGLLGLRAGIQHRRWEAFAALSNLLDRRYVSVVEPLNLATADDAVLNPGAPRSLFFGLRFKY
ncbi:MAG: hypothetical protein OJF61_000693 [Rhodanobacteraceae bacterium]|nr:MAG: hypothetical protein OJF61_000693 [Rhodanobacteraceae bacterium]